jgi:hypothetical protein
MRPAGRSAGGVIDAATLFEFRESGVLVSAVYEGGGVRRGYLIGRRSPGRLVFRYVQMDDAGGIDSGASECVLTLLPDGRIRLTEHFTWATRDGGGTNVIEEISG